MTPAFVADSTARDIVHVRGLFAAERARLSSGNERYRRVTMRIVATRDDNSAAIN